MLTGTITSKLDGNARIWTLTVSREPRPGELIEWDEPKLGAIAARSGVRGWIAGTESNRIGTQILTVAGEGTRWVIVKVAAPKATWVMTSRGDGYKPEVYGSPAAYFAAGDISPSAFLYTSELRNGHGMVGICFMTRKPGWSADHTEWTGSEFMHVYASTLEVADTTAKLVGMVR
jgi:hypothetical protein